MVTTLNEGVSEGQKVPRGASLFKRFISYYVTSYGIVVIVPIIYLDLDSLSVLQPLEVFLPTA